MTTTTNYLAERHWWLHELCRLRASRAAGFSTKAERKAAIKALAQLRADRDGNVTCGAEAVGRYRKVLARVAS